MWMWIVGSVAMGNGPQIVVSGPDEVRVSALDDPIFVASCRGVQWELFNPNTKNFEPAMVPACKETQPAHRIDKTGQLFPLTAMLPPVPEVGFHVVRPIVVYGEKCRENVPFSMAECHNLEVVSGPQMAVRNQGSAKPISVSEEP